ncbi:MAG TPA: hypothetical protein VNW52_06480 [Burkholderiaceae bacterium]|jgi:hypothetical protein|nr:hypothetical protein [Burkholderiaceae bacterium]
MIKKLPRLMLFGLMALSAVVMASPVDNDESGTFPADMCSYSPCQHDIHITIKRKDGSVFNTTFNNLPGAVQPISLAVVAGQVLNFEAAIENGKIVNYKLVEQVTSPEKTIFASFAQSDDGQMILTIRNPFDVAIKFDMAIMQLDSEKILKTSSCPIIPKGSSYEMWPEPLFQVLLLNGRTVEFKDKVDCSSF